MLWRAIEVRGAHGSEASWLERTVLGLSDEQVLLLLRFCTSHVRLMLDGLPRANAGNGRKIIAHFGVLDAGHLPRTHTCSYELDMPHYTSEIELQEKLIIALSSDMGMGMG